MDTRTRPHNVDSPINRVERERVPRPSFDDVRVLAESWRRSLVAANVSRSTLRIYGGAVARFASFLTDRGMPTAVRSISREHVESFVAEMVQTRAANTAATYYRSLRVFFRWLADEGETVETPMARMKPPKVPEVPVPVLSEDELRALLKACEGKTFEDRRDTALLRLFIDSGLRVGEMAGLKIEDVDLDSGIVIVNQAKRRRPRVCAFGKRTTLVIDRYLRLRSRHRHADDPGLWIGQRGAFGTDGLERIVRRRGDLAGITGLHPHLFRHHFAHRWLSQGMNEGDLLALAGWRSRAMLDRYGRSAASERALAAHRASGFADFL